MCVCYTQHRIIIIAKHTTIEPTGKTPLHFNLSGWSEQQQQRQQKPIYLLLTIAMLSTHTHTNYYTQIRDIVNWVWDREENLAHRSLGEHIGCVIKQEIQRWWAKLTIIEEKNVFFPLRSYKYTHNKYTAQNEIKCNLKKRISRWPQNKFGHFALYILLTRWMVFFCCSSFSWLRNQHLYSYRFLALLYSWSVVEEKKRAHVAINSKIQRTIENAH